MAYNRSELFPSRTGIHGGIRRGTAAAAVGAVLVLATGVPASQADEGNPPSGGNAAAGQDAPGQSTHGKEAEEGRQAPAPSVLSVPASLLPAVTASLAPAVTAAPASGSLELATPLPSIPLPAPSDVPLIPPAITGPVQSEQPPAQQVPNAVASAAPTPDTTAQEEPSGAVPMPSPEPDGQARGTAAGAAGGNPSRAEVPASHGGSAQSGAGEVPADPAAAPVSTAPPQAAAARHETVGRIPQAADVPQNEARSAAAIVRPQPELEPVMVGLGVGLVGLAATAGAVYFRMRKP